MRGSIATIHLAAIGAQLALSVDGVDELNRLFFLDVHVSVPGVLSNEDLAALLAGPAKVVFTEEEQQLGVYAGLISEASSVVDVESSRSNLYVRLVPRAWALTQRRASEIWVNRTVPEVIADKLDRIGLVRDVDFVFSLAHTYPTREFIAQYEETDHSFVSRLCEQHGIVMFHEHRDDVDVLCFADTNGAFHDIHRTPLPVRWRRDHPAAFDIKTTLRRVVTSTEAHDYNYRSPLVSLRDAKPVPLPAGLGEWVEYGGHPKTVDDTSRAARLLAEAHGCSHHVVTGTATESSMRAGGTFRLTDAGGGEQELVATRVVLRFRAPSSAGADAPAPWENTFDAIPREVPFRPARVTPWPRIPGLVNAIVDGAIRGEYAELDSAGRYHVRMLHDRSGRTDLTATHPVRMMQPHAGASYGMHFPLRPGAEVLVGFVNGDPDRPVIVGTAPNPLTASPVDRANQTQNVLRTGSNNEVVMEDLRGNERVRVHSPKHDTTLQLGSVEEPEEGALLATQANASIAARDSINAATRQSTLLADGAAGVLGRYASTAVGSIAVTEATARGAETPTSFRLEDIALDLSVLAVRPEDREEALRDAEEQRAANKEKREDEAADDGDELGLWSGLAAAVTELARTSLMKLARATAKTTDEAADDAKGRSQGEPLGQPLEPAALTGADHTAALIGRDTSFVFGDRAAAVSSFGSASVVGTRSAFVKSPGKVEVAAGERVDVTTAGTLDVAAGLARIVAGYYPNAEAPPLDPAVSLGIMSRKDLRIHSVEDCILICAKKHLVGSAHDGDVRLTAAKTVLLRGGAITGTAGPIKFKASETFIVEAADDILLGSDADILIEASGDVVIKGASVTIEAASITLKGNTTVEGDLTVTGNLIAG